MTDSYVHPPIVYTRVNWLDSWAEEPNLRPLSLEFSTGGHGAGGCQLLGWYGFGKNPDEETASEHSAVELLPGTWVKVEVWDRVEEDYVTAFVGFATGQSRELMGDDRPGAWQVYEVLGPLELLRRRCLGRSRWWDETSEETFDIDWVPSLNDLDGRAVKQGNRTDETHENPEISGSSSYLYGGVKTWTYLDYLTYVLKQFCDVEGGPIWTIGGQSVLLDSLSDPIEFDPTSTADEVVDVLISRENGLDYKIVDTSEGFEIEVFSLLPDDVTFGATTLSGNTNHVQFIAGVTYQNIETHVSQNWEETYGTIRVIGERIVVCMSLWGESILPEHVIAATLLPGWDSTDETDYCTASGNYVNQYRANDRFDAVFATFHASPFVHSYTPETNPLANADGSITPISDAKYQMADRETLDWLPLSTAIKYGETEEDDEGIALYSASPDVEPELQRPAVWGKYFQANASIDGFVIDSYIRLDEAGIHLSVLSDRLGLHLECSPNHWIGPPEGTTLNSPGIAPLVRYDELVATIAFRTDSRLHLEYTVPDAIAGMVKEIYVPDAECWWLAPNTCVGTEKTGETAATLIITSEGRELRNDHERLEMRMAGAIARYGNPRARAVITLMDAVPAASLVGVILDQVENGADVFDIAAPITTVSIQWSARGGVARTTIATGYAEVENGTEGGGTFEWHAPPPKHTGPAAPDLPPRKPRPAGAEPIPSGLV